MVYSSTVRALFNRLGAVGGSFRIAEGTTVVVDRPLTEEVIVSRGLSLIDDAR